jgi:two-component system phosphate regulon response regulator PhoB
MKVLIVEDEADIRDLLALHLRREGLVTDLAADAREGWEKLQSGDHDLAILDWMLPGGASGLDLARQIRSHPKNRSLSILMLTARVSDHDIVAGLEAGADDYVTKPFEMPVLMARVRALLRRSKWLESSSTKSEEQPVEERGQVLQVGEIRIIEEQHRVEVRGRELPLTPYEFRLLSSLMKNAGKVLTRERLIELVQGSGVSVVDRAIDTHVFGLRKKLGSSADHIETVRGVGYRMCPPEGPHRSLKTS